jgi:hypothetical protein
LTITAITPAPIRPPTICADVRAQVLAVEALGHEQADRHRRVEVTARDVADGVGHRHHGQAERQRDAEQAAGLAAGQDRRAAPADHQPGRPDRFCQ